MNMIVFITACLVPATGLYVLFRGDWKNLKLKYAAVAISTAAAFLYVGHVVISYIFLGIGFFECARDDGFCTTIYLYSFSRNMAFILFHLAVGRDARVIKKCGDRRNR